MNSGTSDVQGASDQLLSGATIEWRRRVDDVMRFGLELGDRSAHYGTLADRRHVENARLVDEQEGGL